VCLNSKPSRERFPAVQLGLAAMVWTPTALTGCWKRRCRTAYNNAGLCGSVVPLSSGRMYFTWNTALGTDCLTGSPIVSTATPTMTPSVAPTTSPTTAAPSATPTAVTVSPTGGPTSGPTAAPSSATPTTPTTVYTVSSITSFSALDISAFDDTAFSTSFQATFQSQIAAYAGVDADNVAIVSIESGSVQVLPRQP
jgi:hypothetical protein